MSEQQKETREVDVWTLLSMASEVSSLCGYVEGMACWLPHMDPDELTKESMERWAKRGSDRATRAFELLQRVLSEADKSEQQTEVQADE